jgi:hypothetical protein
MDKDSVDCVASGSAGAPAEKEITPEMIEAGGIALWGMLMHDPLISPSFAEELAEEVLRAALSARPDRSGEAYR